MCQENLNNKAKQRELWEKLEKATQNVHKELYGMRCKIEGVIREKESHDKDGVAKQWINELDKFSLALSEIRLELTMDSMEFYIPNYFITFSNSSITGTNDYDTVGTITILKKIRNAVLYVEGNSLPGNNTAYNSYGLASKLLEALFDFEDCFLEYVEYADC